MAATKEKELSIEEKLRLLYDLQNIDTEIDKMQILKGELPEEVRVLEDEIAGLQVRVDKLNEEIAELEEEHNNRKQTKAMAKELITRYEKQQGSVKNNREFEALSKEIDLQKLEIQLCDKKMGDATIKLDIKKGVIAETETAFKNREKDLKAKNKELEKIIEETEKEEIALKKESDKASKKIEERLLSAYTRIRKAYKNGLAVVSVQRDSCGGCFAKIPPQRQADINSKKRIILCENCGRILVATDFGGVAE
jgi:predicted  nucleic acid-binding Zn-ribbon protein